MPIEVSTMTAGAPAQGADDIPVSREGEPRRLSVDDLALYAASPHRGYHFHGFAAQQIAGDPKFYDLAGLNHASFGVNLSNANAWTNAGYVSTVDPSGGSADSVFRIPNLNFDYSGGEKLVLWWLGKVTQEGGSVSFLGDGINGTYHGMRLRANSNSKAQLVLYDTTNSSGLFGGSTTGTPFDGSLQSFGLVLDGQAKKYGYWVNEAFDTALHGADYSAFGAGADVDTTNANTFQVGSAAPAAAASTDGIATQTRALVLLRLSASDAVPAVSVVTSLFQQLRANPGKLILNAAF